MLKTTVPNKSVHRFLRWTVLLVDNFAPLPLWEESVRGFSRSTFALKSSNKYKEAKLEKSTSRKSDGVLSSGS